jgi:ADP-heptose:LPS heptosyltransferase
MLAALLQGSQLLVGHATGVAHLAAALHVNSVIVVQGDGERAAWPPQNRQRHRLVCRFGGATPADVLAQARDLLDADSRPWDGAARAAPAWT